MIHHVSLQPQDFYGWKGYSLSAGDIQLGITPEIGGRIISLKFQDKELFFVNEKFLGETFEIEKISNWKDYKKTLGHHLWGGDKTWVAPEPAWIHLLPPLDLDAGKYSFELESRAIVMKSPVDRETGLQIIRRVELSEEGTIILDQKFINQSHQPVICAIWNVTQLLRPFQIYLPVSSDKIKPDGRFNAGVTLRNQLIDDSQRYVAINCQKPILFKYGSPVTQGCVVAIKPEGKEVIAIKRVFEIFPGEHYFNGEIVQVYNSSDFNYLELEILAPKIKLLPGKETIHRQYWYVKNFNKHVSIDDIFNK